MKCENCKEEHSGDYGSGRFCSSKCARSFVSKKNVGTKIVQCIDCGKDIEVSKRASAKQCKCDNCRKSYKCNKFKFCKHCGNRLDKSRSSRTFCNVNCKNEYYYNKYIDDWKSGKKDGMKGLTQLSIHIRKYLFKKFENKCSKCGWNHLNKYTYLIPLQVNHIDGNHENNNEENLELLCPNCHSLTENYGYRNNGQNGRHAKVKKKHI